jgi:hypothetical protein
MTELREPNMLPEDQRLFFEMQGGYSLGMQIASKISPNYNFTMPKQLTYQETNPIEDGQILDHLSEGFGVKTSGTKESFSEYSARGVNSSRHSFWDGKDYDLGMDIINESKKRLTSKYVKSLVFQEYIKGSKVNMHVTDTDLLCETDRETERLLIYKTKREDNTELVNTVSPQPAIPTTVLRGIINSAWHMRRDIAFDYDVELMVNENGAYITQLRPLPNQDCLDIKQSDYQPGSLTEIHETRYVNGLWSSRQSYEVDHNIDNEPFVALKKNKDIRKCQDIQESLNAQIPTLVLDPFSGFRITHEPYHLPEDLKMRRYFGYISIASCRSNIDPGQTVIASLSSDSGVLYYAQ